MLGVPIARRGNILSGVTGLDFEEREAIAEGVWHEWTGSHQLLENSLSDQLTEEKVCLSYAESTPSFPGVIAAELAHEGLEHERTAIVNLPRYRLKAGRRAIEGTAQLAICPEPFRVKAWSRAGLVSVKDGPPVATLENEVGSELGVLGLVAAVLADQLATLYSSISGRTEPARTEFIVQMHVVNSVDARLERAFHRLSRGRISSVREIEKEVDLAPFVALTQDAERDLESSLRPGYPRWLVRESEWGSTLFRSFLTDDVFDCWGLAASGARTLADSRASLDASRRLGNRIAQHL